ncbi:MAG: rRNA adenine N-6-methyltransferase family protein, partial [Candidatus Bathyarchaeota archaeon]
NGNVEIVEANFLKIDFGKLLGKYPDIKEWKVVGNLPYYITTNILLHLIGGLLGGALVARNVSEQETIKSGAITGLLAYVFHQIIFFIFFGAGVIGDPYTLIALIGGSIVGAFLYGKMGKR